MPQYPLVRIRMILNGPGVGIPVDLFRTALRAVNDEIYRHEAKLLEQFATASATEGSVEIDAARHRIAGYRKHAVTVRAARSGSLDIELIPALLCLYVLKQTFGNSLSQAWQKTDAHQALMALLTNDIGSSAQALGVALARVLENKLHAPVTLTFFPPADPGSGPRGEIRLRVDLPPNRDTPPTTMEGLDETRPE